MFSNLKWLIQLAIYSKTASDFISDLINQRLRLKTKPTRSQFMRIYFDNKGIEMVNISRLPHKANDAIPDSFKIQDPPTILFLRSPTTGSKIFTKK